MLIDLSFYLHILCKTDLQEIRQKIIRIPKISQFFKTINILLNRIDRVAIFLSRESAQSDEKIVVSFRGF